MKYVAKVRPALRIEIVFDALDDPVMLYRYAQDDEFRGETWYETLHDAFTQAETEYGVKQSDFAEVLEDSETPD